MSLKIGVTAQFAEGLWVFVRIAVLKNARLPVAPRLGSPIIAFRIRWLPRGRIGDFGNSLACYLVFLGLDLAVGAIGNLARLYIFIFDLAHRAVVAHIIASADKLERDAVAGAVLVSVRSLGSITVIYPC
jgi:hypothetical protein